MALAILFIWLYFIIAFILVRLLFPEISANKRSRKEIKAAREFDESGYDQNGFSPLGYHRNGTRYDDDGFDRYGLDKNGNKRQKLDYDNDVARSITVSAAKRKGIAAAILIPLAIVMIVIPTANFIINDSCLLGHKPVFTFCETPIKCTRCESEISPAPGHTWKRDAKTGEDVCTECQAVKSDLE